MKPYYKKNNYTNNNNNNYKRVGFAIKSPIVRLVQDGTQLGVMNIEQARKLAQEAGLDLVEINSSVNPPICYILDYKKFKYEAKIKEKEQKKKQKVVILKEVRFSPSISEHDIDYRIKFAKSFLESGHKVKLNLKFSNREIIHKDLGFQVIKKVVDALVNDCKVTSIPKMEGRNNIICILDPINSK